MFSNSKINFSCGVSSLERMFRIYAIWGWWGGWGRGEKKTYSHTKQKKFIFALHVLCKWRFYSNSASLSNFIHFFFCFLVPRLLLKILIEKKSPKAPELIQDEVLFLLCILISLMAVSNNLLWWLGIWLLLFTFVLSYFFPLFSSGPMEEDVSSFCLNHMLPYVESHFLLCIYKNSFPSGISQFGEVQIVPDYYCHWYINPY